MGVFFFSQYFHLLPTSGHLVVYHCVPAGMWSLKNLSVHSSRPWCFWLKTFTKGKKIIGKMNKCWCQNSLHSKDCPIKGYNHTWLIFFKDLKIIEKELTAILDICVCMLEFLSAWEKKIRKTGFSLGTKQIKLFGNKLIRQTNLYSYLSKGIILMGRIFKQRTS